MTCGRCGDCKCLTARIKRRLKLKKAPRPLSLHEYADGILADAKTAMTKVSNNGAPSVEIPFRRLEFAITQYERVRAANLPVEAAMISLETATKLLKTELLGEKVTW